MAFPNNKAHRTSRRKLGKGQHVQLPQLTATVSRVTVSTATNYGAVTLTFNIPAVVNGNLDIKPVNGATFVSQSQISQTVFQLTYSPPLISTTTIGYSGIASGSSVANSSLGGGFAGISAGSF